MLGLASSYGAPPYLEQPNHEEYAIEVQDARVDTWKRLNIAMAT